MVLFLSTHAFLLGNGQTYPTLGVPSSSKPQFESSTADVRHGSSHLYQYVFTGRLHG